jgi:hypothetical protein
VPQKAAYPLKLIPEMDTGPFTLAKRTSVLASAKAQPK